MRHPVTRGRRAAQPGARRDAARHVELAREVGDAVGLCGLVHRRNAERFRTVCGGGRPNLREIPPFPPGNLWVLLPPPPPLQSAGPPHRSPRFPPPPPPPPAGPPHAR